MEERWVLDRSVSTEWFSPEASAWLAPFTCLHSRIYLYLFEYPANPMRILKGRWAAIQPRKTFCHQVSDVILIRDFFVLFRIKLPNSIITSEIQTRGLCSPISKINSHQGCSNYAGSQQSTAVVENTALAAKLCFVIELFHCLITVVPRVKYGC